MYGAKVQVELKVVVGIREGSFNTVDDLKTYVFYRLGMRSRETDNVVLDEVSVVSVKKFNEQLEIQL